MSHNKRPFLFKTVKRDEKLNTVTDNGTCNFMQFTFVQTRTLLESPIVVRSRLYRYICATVATLSAELFSLSLGYIVIYCRNITIKPRVVLEYLKKSLRVILRFKKNIHISPRTSFFKDIQFVNQISRKPINVQIAVLRMII